MENIDKDFEKFVVGFVAGEGWFTVAPASKISKKQYFITEFGINLHKNDGGILYLIKDYLKCGSVKTYDNMIRFRVSKREDLINKIIPLFERNYMYGTNKQESFDRWKIVVKLISDKKHLIDGNVELIIKLAFDINGINSKGRNNPKRK